MTAAIASTVIVAIRNKACSISCGSMILEGLGNPNEESTRDLTSGLLSYGEMYIRPYHEMSLSYQIIDNVISEI